MQCAVADNECVTGRLRRGLCEKHYRRSLKHGGTDSSRIDNLSHYEPDGSGCWNWAGAMWPNGYGKTSRELHGTRLAHRVFFVKHRGVIPEGLDLDHLCRNRLCVNPDHLEPVNRATNLHRGHESRTMCESGRHDITHPGALRVGTKQCVECWRIRYRKAAERYRAKGSSVPNADGAHSPDGRDA